MRLQQFSLPTHAQLPLPWCPPPPPPQVWTSLSLPLRQGGRRHAGVSPPNQKPPRKQDLDRLYGLKHSPNTPLSPKHRKFLANIIYAKLSRHPCDNLQCGSQTRPGRNKPRPAPESDPFFCPVKITTTMPQPSTMVHSPRTHKPVHGLP